MNSLAGRTAGSVFEGKEGLREGLVMLLAGLVLLVRKGGEAVGPTLDLTRGGSSSCHREPRGGRPAGWRGVARRGAA
ncbi:hypothetical protein WDL1P1_00234 (plasmid) [Variovorax sp. WDL1]|nr:hypothetical protein CHC06_05817 [Variovorax sp. B2]PNG51067.1 hypothetical protein CHC07_05723 [Variovorax sp. B4]VTV17248.1 hypothetical protein WDL1P1_00234 [Variovorax sp. WDL1]